MINQILVCLHCPKVHKKLIIWYENVINKTFSARNGKVAENDWPAVPKYKQFMDEGTRTGVPLTYVYYHGIYGQFSRDSWGQKKT